MQHKDPSLGFDSGCNGQSGHAMVVHSQYAPASAHKGARALKKGETGAGEGPYLLVKLLRWSNSVRKERSGGSSSARRLGRDPARNSRAWRGVEGRRRGG